MNSVTKNTNRIRVRIRIGYPTPTLFRVIRLGLQMVYMHLVNFLALRTRLLQIKMHYICSLIWFIMLIIAVMSEYVAEYIQYIND